jgi:riboflavin biosynthesis pyrimidine reductase
VAASAFLVLAEQETSSPRCALEEEYGAALVLDSERVAVNFVSTIDGIVSFGTKADDSRAVGGGVLADRTLMAMLRAVAGVIVVGAGTLRATLNHQWTPEALAPERAGDLAELRRAAGRPDELAPLLVVTRSGGIPAGAVAVAGPAVPLHIHRGAHGDLSAEEIVRAAREFAGGGPLLCEGGPHLFGALLAGGVPIDLFLTVAPQVAGRSERTPERRSLVEGVGLQPFSHPGELRSVRRAEQHLLLRYAIDAHQPPPA